MIAKWYFDQRGELDTDDSFERTVQKLNDYLNRNQIPLMILAVENKQILGVAQLKYHEMKIFPDKKHWLGGVYVPEKYRDKKVGQKLTKKIENITKSLGVRTLNLQT